MEQQTWTQPFVLMSTMSHLLPIEDGRTKLYGIFSLRINSSSSSLFHGAGGNTATMCYNKGSPSERVDDARAKSNSFFRLFRSNEFLAPVAAVVV